MATQTEEQAILRQVSTATITTLLLKKGVRNIWMRGPRPLLGSSARVAGRAFTLAFLPMREDLATPGSWSSSVSTRTAMEAMPAGAIVVADARGVLDAGIFGDILCARMVKRGGLALVTDGVVRDREGIERTGLAVWAQAVAAPASIAGLTFTGWQQPIGCGGVAVFPDDMIVADTDGAVVIPKSLVEFVLEAGPQQEREEAWIADRVAEGEPLPGLYPMNEETRRRYEAARDKDADRRK